MGTFIVVRCESRINKKRVRRDKKICAADLKKKVKLKTNEQNEAPRLFLQISIWLESVVCAIFESL